MTGPVLPRARSGATVISADGRQRPNTTPNGTQADLDAAGWREWWIEYETGDGDWDSVPVFYCPDCWAAEGRGEWTLL